MRQSQLWIISSVMTALLAGPALAADQSMRAKIAEQKAEVLERKAEAGESPPPAPLITRPGAQAVDPAGTAPLDDAITCLARSIYWEAKGENEADMAAVANVVMNRLSNDGFPKTVCGVVTEGSEQGRCQFSWWCDGRPDSAQEEGPYKVAKEIARKALNQQLPDRTHGALYFHGRGITPSWAPGYIRTYQTKVHVFYKPPGKAAK